MILDCLRDEWSYNDDEYRSVGHMAVMWLEERNNPVSGVYDIFKHYGGPHERKHAERVLKLLAANRDV